jgi:cytochrome c
LQARRRHWRAGGIVRSRWIGWLGHAGERIVARWLLVLVVAATAGSIALTGCVSRAPIAPLPQVMEVQLAARTVPDGDRERGKRDVAAYGCGACHVVPGVAGARGLVGPPLTSFAHRSHLAGSLPNTADHLVRWLQSPQSIRPGSAMPNLGVTEADARDIAAYLYSLE